MPHSIVFLYQSKVYVWFFVTACNRFLSAPTSLVHIPVRVLLVLPWKKTQARSSWLVSGITRALKFPVKFQGNYGQGSD